MLVAPSCVCFPPAPAQHWVETDWGQVNSADAVSCPELPQAAAASADWPVLAVAAPWLYLGSSPLAAAVIAQAADTTTTTH